MNREVLLALSILSTPLTSMGAMVDVQFTGSTSSITYSQCTNLLNGNCRAWNHTYPSSVQFYGPTQMGVGDAFGGSLRYDSTTPLSGISSDGSQATHLYGVTDFNFNIGSLTLPDLDLEKSGLGHFAIINNRGTTDSFYLTQWLSGQDWFSTVSISLFDWGGTAYSDFTVPIIFNLDQFDSLYFSVAFLRRSDGDQVHLSGFLTSFDSSVSSVPEPSGLLLLATGLLFLAEKRVRSRAVFDRSLAAYITRRHA